MSCPFVIGYLDKDSKYIFTIGSNLEWVSPPYKEIANFIMNLPWVEGTECIDYFGLLIDKKYLRSFYHQNECTVERDESNPTWVNFFKTSGDSLFTDDDIKLRDWIANALQTGYFPGR